MTEGQKNDFQWEEGGLIIKVGNRNRQRKGENKSYNINKTGKNNGKMEQEQGRM